ncbi:MAG: LysM peptidoglycan-binding domain-containing protein [Clostridia bacterium]
MKNGKIFVNVIILIIVIVTVATCVNYTSGKTEYKTKEIIVDDGTTLWNIAGKICKKNDNLKIRNVINDIIELNNLDNSVIYENQKLLVYIY